MKDGVYEVINQQLVPVTQGIKETKDTATFLSFGDVVETRIIPIAEACKPCDFWKRIGSRKACRKFQEKDARARGFTEVICPNQFIDA